MNGYKILFRSFSQALFRQQFALQKPWCFNKRSPRTEIETITEKLSIINATKKSGRMHKHFFNSTDVFHKSIITIRCQHLLELLLLQSTRCTNSFDKYFRINGWLVQLLVANRLTWYFQISDGFCGGAGIAHHPHPRHFPPEVDDAPFGEACCRGAGGVCYWNPIWVAQHVAAAEEEEGASVHPAAFGAFWAEDDEKQRVAQPRSQVLGSCLSVEVMMENNNSI